MGSLAFFPRLLQNDARRVACSFNNLQKIEVKGKVISNSKVIEEHFRIYTRKSEPNYGIRRCYHTDFGNYIECDSENVTVNGDQQHCSEISLIDKCKSFWDSLRKHLISLTTLTTDVVIIPHEQIMPKSQNSSRNISCLHRPSISYPELNPGRFEAIIIDDGNIFQCNKRSTFNLCEKKESVFKDVLAVFPLGLPGKAKRRKYLDKKKDANYEDRMKRMEEMLQALQKAGYLQEVDRTIVMQELEIQPKMTHAAHILPEVDQTMQAMLSYMKSKNSTKQARNQANKSAPTNEDLNVKEALSQVINVNPSDRLTAATCEEFLDKGAQSQTADINPDKPTELKNDEVKDALSQALYLNPMEQPMELDCKKPPNCLPPLGPMPQLAPPPKSVPPLPSCKPKPHKPKNRDK